ncbi:MAG TPA: hypothetical protein VNN10_09990 [Dehalococcoidia bacterium]|nr:hypothetical protein [Dehalococcoidia bacterium]
MRRVPGWRELLAVDPEEALMVAAHPSDLRAAMTAACSRPVCRRRVSPAPGEPGAGDDGDLSPQPDFHVTPKDFENLEDQLLP